MVTTGLATAGAVSGWAVALASGAKRVSLSDILVSAKAALRDVTAERNAQLHELTAGAHERNLQKIRIGTLLTENGHQLERITALDRENHALAESIIQTKRERDEALAVIQRRRAQAKAAGDRGRVTQTKKAKEKHGATAAATHQAIAGEPWPTREQVVAPVREKRAAKKSRATA